MAELILTTKDELRSLLREELQTISQDKIASDGLDDLLTRADVAHMFNISLVTVHAWMKIGQLPFNRIGGKTYFKKSEVMSALKQIKIRKKY